MWESQRNEIPGDSQHCQPVPPPAAKLPIEKKYMAATVSRFLGHVKKI